MGARDSAPIAMFVEIVPTPEWHDVTGPTSDPTRAAPALVATADFRKGVLEVTVPAPSRPEQKSRRLEVREEK